MIDAFNLIAGAVSNVMTMFEYILTQTGATVPIMATLGIVFAVRFLIMPILGTSGVGSDKAKKRGE